MHLLYGVDHPDVTHYRLMDPNDGHLKPFPFEHLSCADFNSTFPRKIIDLQANFWYGRLIQLNPHYRHRIQQLFAAEGDAAGAEPDIYGALVRVLLEPSHSVLRAKCDIQQRLFGASTGGSGAPPLACHALQVRSTREIQWKTVTLDAIQWKSVTLDAGAVYAAECAGRQCGTCRFWRQNSRLRCESSACWV